MSKLTDFILLQTLFRQFHTLNKFYLRERYTVIIFLEYKYKSDPFVHRKEEQQEQKRGRWKIEQKISQSLHLYMAWADFINNGHNSFLLVINAIFGHMIEYPHLHAFHVPEILIWSAICPSREHHPHKNCNRRQCCLIWIKVLHHQITISV